MLLRATVGPYLGEVRDYTYAAARAALEAGFAEPAGEVPASLAALVRPTPSRCYVGMDLSSTKDLTARVVVETAPMPIVPVRRKAFGRR